MTEYGGGGGMVIMCDPVFKAIESVKTEKSKVILMTPTGKVYKLLMIRNIFPITK